MFSDFSLISLKIVRFTNRKNSDVAKNNKVTLTKSHISFIFGQIIRRGDDDYDIPIFDCHNHDPQTAKRKADELLSACMGEEDDHHYTTV